MRSTFYLALVLSIAVFSACKKTDTVPPKSEKFKINGISISSSSPIAGQRLSFSADLADTIGNIEYEWQLFFEGKSEGDPKEGRSLKTINVNPQKPGDYILKLKIDNGPNNSDTFEKKFTTKKSSFDYGVWGDSETTIKNAESDNGNQEDVTFRYSPLITQTNNGIQHIVYKKGESYVTYYLSGGKLIAGAKSTYIPISENGIKWHETYTAAKDSLTLELKTQATETINWTIPAADRSPYSSPEGLSSAIEMNYAQIESKWIGGNTSASLKIEFSPANNILLTTIYRRTN